MRLYRELDPGEKSKETDFFVKGMRPSASIRKILRPLGEWTTADDIKESEKSKVESNPEKLSPEGEEWK